MEKAQRRKWLWRMILVGLVMGGGLLYVLIVLDLPSQGMARYFCNLAAERYGIRCQLQKISLRFGRRVVEAVRLVDLTIFERGTEEVLLHAKEIRVIPRLSLGGQGGWIGVEGIDVQEPVLHLRRTRSGRWNLQEMLASPDADQGVFPLPHQITIRQGTLRMDGTAFSGIELFAEVAPDGKVQVRGYGFPLPLFLKQGSLKAILEMDSRRWPLIEGSILLAGIDLVAEGDQPLGNPVLHASLRVDPLTGSGEAKTLALADRGWRVRGSGSIQPSGQQGYAYRFLLQEGEVHLSEMHHLFPSLPDLRLQVMAGQIQGTFALRDGGWRLQGEASLQGRVKSRWLRGEDPITVEVAWTGDGGDLQVTSLQAQGPSVGTLKMTGVLKGWGQEGIHFRSEELHLQPALMGRILSRLTPGTQIEEISRPEVRGTLTSFQGPLELTLVVEQLQVSAGGHPLLLQGAEGMFRSGGREWEGTGRARRVSTTLGDMRGVEMELFGRGGVLEIRRVEFQLPATSPLHFAGDGTVTWEGGGTTLEIQGGVNRSTPFRDGRLQLLITVRRSPRGGWSAKGRVSADAEALLEFVQWHREVPFWASRGRVTADWEGTMGGGQARSVSGRIQLEGVDLGYSPSGDSTPLLTGVHGTIPFHLHGEGWLIPRTILQSHPGLSLSLQGRWDQDQGLQMDVGLPRTPVASLVSSLRALLPRETQGSGVVKARGSWNGKSLSGEILLDQVHLRIGGLFLTGMNGTIPLGPAAHSSPPEIHWPELTAEVHQRAQQELERQPPPPKTLTVKAVGYQGLAVRDMILHLIPGDRSIAITPLTFRIYRGQGWGRGKLDLMRGTAHLALLFDDISLTELLNQFPPLRGYLSGRVDGLADVLIPLSHPAKARGRGRWWVIKSPEEERIISQEMIERLGGPPAQFFQILTGRDRAYDVGVLTAIVDQGYLVFPELEISHRILGIKDLEIRVVPPFNRIALDHLIDSILEAMERAGTPRGR